MDAAEYEAFLDGKVTPHAERDFAVTMPEGGYLLVADGVLRAWLDAVPGGLPTFNYLGYQGTDEDSYLPPPGEAALEAEACPVCEAVREGRVAEYREELAAERAERRALRARAGMRIV